MHWAAGCIFILCFVWFALRTYAGTVYRVRTQYGMRFLVLSSSGPALDWLIVVARCG